MDKTEQYIKMCEKAEEIQDCSWGNEGDYFYKRDGIGYGLWLVCKVEYGSLWCSGQRMNEAPFNGKLVQFMAPGNYIWLPRQDQLQEMVGDAPYSNIKNAMWSILDDLHKYAFTPNIFNEFIPTTMEQLWLAFVMKEKYNQIWNGEKWLKQ